MKIFTLVSELPPTRSGVAFSAARLVELFREMGHEAEAVAMRELPKLVRGELRLSFFFLRWPSLRRTLLGYDVLHVHGPAPTFSDVLLLLLRLTTSRSSRPKVVYTHHFDLDLPGLRLPCRLYERLHARVLRGADSVVVTTSAYRRRLLARGLGDVHVVPWGSDHRSHVATRRAEDRFDVLSVAQLRAYKGLDVLLRAFRRLTAADLHVVGDGRRRADYEALAARLELATVRFRGRLDDAELDELFAACHAIVLPSVSKMEAFGIALLEGMRSGCVPIASDLPGVGEVVGDAGILVPPGDEDALAEALLRLQRDRALLARLSSRAVRKASSYRWRETAEQYVSLFDRLVRPRGAPVLGEPSWTAPRHSDGGLC